MKSATRRIRADGRFAGLPILGHDRQRLAGRPRSRLAAGMNDHVAKPIDKERLVLCLLGHLGRSGAGAPATAADAGELVEARGDIVGRFGGSPGADRPGVAALRSGHAGPLRPARTPARRGRCPVAARDPAYHQGQRFHRWRQRPPAASELEQALRRADRLRGMEILAGIRLDELRTLCDACLLRLQAMFGDVQGVGELKPRRGGQSRQGFRRTRGSPASAAVVGRITPWALSADTR